MSSFWVRFKFVISSLCQASIVTFVEVLSVRVSIRDLFHFCNTVTVRSIRYSVNATLRDFFFAYAKSRFSHDVAHTVETQN